MRSRALHLNVAAVVPVWWCPRLFFFKVQFNTKCWKPLRSCCAVHLSTTELIAHAVFFLFCLVSSSLTLTSVAAPGVALWCLHRLPPFLCKNKLLVEIRSKCHILPNKSHRLFFSVLIQTLCCLPVFFLIPHTFSPYSSLPSLTLAIFLSFPGSNWMPALIWLRLSLRVGKERLIGLPCQSDRWHCDLPTVRR